MERFHQSLRLELLDDHEPFTSLLAAQAAIESTGGCAAPIAVVVIGTRLESRRGSR